MNCSERNIRVDEFQDVARVTGLKGADALLALGGLGLVQPKRCFYRPENGPGRQFRGGDHNIEGFLFDFFLHCHHLLCSRVLLILLPGTGSVQQSRHEEAEKGTCFKECETDKKVQHSTPQSMQMQVSFCPSAIRVVL